MAGVSRRHHELPAGVVQVTQWCRDTPRGHEFAHRLTCTFPVTVVIELIFKPPGLTRSYKCARQLDPLVKSRRRYAGPKRSRFV